MGDQTDSTGRTQPGPIRAGALRRRAAHLAAGLASFARGPGARRRLAVEAGWELARARIETLRPAARYASFLGRRDAATAPLGPRDEALAAEIGAVVAAVAAAAPFRARCLQQALAVRRMLARRGVPVTVHIGMALDPAAREAHAWVTAGDRVVSGGTDLDRFVVIGSFS
jgi:hypothetical protein